ncbi:MAG TPA: L,D-transpeptidase [Gemmatimonadaceae bacterium]|nr:L,D-transpeptidase [Gemmatimonadaceae bacterium]
MGRTALRLLGAAMVLATAVASGVAGAQGDARAAALHSEGFRVIVSLERRRLWVVDRGDTLLAARVAVGKGTTLAYGGSAWSFDTPRGVRTVLAKERDPVWVAPDWSYIETAEREGLAVRWLAADRPVTLRDGRVLAMRDGAAGVVGLDGQFRALPLDEHIVFDDALWIPPMGSRNRRVPGVLGAYRLVLGDGIGFHGTNDPGSVGRKATHGCMRLDDADIAWLYEHVPVGTRVYIY